MEDINIFFFLFGLLAPLILFMFLRHILDNKSTWKMALRISALIALVGLILTISAVGHDRMNFSVSLIFPLFSIAIYRPIFLWFSTKLKRPPIDTAMNWHPGLFWDRAFNITYVLLTTVVVGFFILILASFLR
jgi:hypothetical protein